MYFLAMLYFIGILVCWNYIRDEYIKEGGNADGMDVFMCICPIINLVVLVAIILTTMKEKKLWNRFFLLKEEE